MCGDAGPYAVGALLFHALNDYGKTEDCINR